MVADGVEARPIDLWAWGIRNRSGHLFKRDPEFVKLNLLPGDQATVTERGIRYRNLYYTNERAVAENWFATARQKGSWRVGIAYDPRDTSAIYLRLREPRVTEYCRLMEASSQFQGCSWEDINNFFSAIFSPSI